MADAAPNDQRSAPGRNLGFGFACLVAVTGALIVLGALVRAHGAGLACPDWPLCFGRFVPRFDFRIAYEWGHRVLASGVSLGLAVLTVAVLRNPPLRRWVRRPLALAWGLLVVQVLLGALTVWLLLRPWTVTAHLLVGISFCVTLLWIARDLFESEREPQRAPVPPSVGVLASVAGLALVVQLALGGWVSSHGAGLACPGFPTCDGERFVPALSGLVGIQVLHRLNALVLLGAIAALVWGSRRSPRVHRLAHAALRLVVLQIGVGAVNVLLRLKVEVTALHTALAAALALLLALAVREAILSRAGFEPEPTASPGSHEPTLSAARSA